MSESDEETYTIPLRDQRYFGAGIKRKRVQFVRSSTTTTPSCPSGGRPASTASERYLAIVFNRAQSEPAGAEQQGASLSNPGDDVTSHGGDQTDQSIEKCAVCSLPVIKTRASHQHESSLAHQVCLPHTHPPSALDRKRKGVSILQSYGWDPDKRAGLGVTGEGILHPIKAKEKRDTIGLDVSGEKQSAKKPIKKPGSKQTGLKLDAGKIRKLEAEGRKEDERLRHMFYSNDEVDKYLGGG